MVRPTIAVHGGAGGRPPRDDRPHRAALAEALTVGGAILGDGGGSALEAVIAAVRVLEDFPLLNAGVGSVLNRDGAVEMDAAVMCGRTLQAGAVAVVTRVRNPVLLAEGVRRRSPHVLLAGAAADRQAEEWGLDLADNEFFVTERQRERWAQARPEHQPGTVGAVALDRDGHLAAATSTGGVRGKLPGRVGDSALPGAGTYADDAACAVSVTGDGEPVMRAVLAHEVAARVRLQGASLVVAAEAAIHERLKALDGDGGLIAVSADGEVAMPFSTEVMFRGCLRSEGEPRVAVGGEELRELPT